MPERDRPQMPISNPRPVPRRDPTNPRVRLPEPDEQRPSWLGRLARRAKHVRAIALAAGTLVTITAGCLLYFAPAKAVDKHTQWLQALESRLGKAEVEQVNQQQDIRDEHEDIKWIMRQTYQNQRHSGAPAIPLPAHERNDGGTP